MNDVTTYQGGVPATPEDLEKGLQNLQSTIQTGAGSLPYLRLMKSGKFVYGQENIELEPGDIWAINPYSIQHGYVSWTDHEGNQSNEVVGEVMVPFSQQPPAESELPDTGWKWNHQVAFMLQCVDGEDEGQAVLYKGTSLGLRNAVKELINAIIGQLQQDKVNFVPLCELSSDSYQHKKYGEVMTPKIDITEWVSMDGIKSQDDAAAEDDEGDEPEAEEPPKRRGRTSKADAKEPSGNRRARRRRKA